MVIHTPKCIGGEALGRVLAAEVAAGRMDEAEVEPIARGILAGNSERVYRLQAAA
jgi:hypothetical protein